MQSKSKIIELIQRALSNFDGSTCSAIDDNKTKIDIPVIFDEDDGDIYQQFETFFRDNAYIHSYNNGLLVNEETISYNKLEIETLIDILYFIQNCQELV